MILFLSLTKQLKRLNIINIYSQNNKKEYNYFLILIFN